MAKKIKITAKTQAPRKKKKKPLPIFPALFTLMLVGGCVFFAEQNNKKASNQQVSAQLPSSTNTPIDEQHSSSTSTPVNEQKSTPIKIAAKKVTSLNVDPKIHQFLDSYCIKCHGDEKQKGDRRFDELATVIKTDKDIIAWSEILDSLNLGEMPPEKKSVVHPSSEENRFVIDWLTESLQKIESDALKHETTLRRLNRFEYVQTMASLLQVNVDAFDPTALFPKDAESEGFDNIGDELVLSDFQLRQYLAAAEKFLDKAIFFTEQPQSKKMTFTGKDFGGNKKMARAGVFWTKNVDDKYLEVGHGRPTGNGVTYPSHFRRRAIAHDGEYIIRVKADAANRLTHPYKAKDIHLDLTKKIKMSLVAAHNRNAIRNDRTKRQIIKIFELEDEKVQWYETKSWLNKDAIPFVHWVNGSASTKNFINKIGYKYHPEVTENLKTAQNLKLQNQGIKPTGQVLSDVYRGPVMRIHGWEIEGPLFKSWPPASHKSIFGQEIDPAKVNIAKTLSAFASKAFRQPMSEKDVSHYTAYVNKRLGLGDSRAVALKHGLKAILTSPNFLFIEEGSGGLLNQFQLATRLSFFLWSSQPDQQLTQLAAAGKLNEATIRQQVKRMLADPKSASFSKHFTDSWLRLNTLGSMPPSSKFKSYYSDRLETAMRQETLLFFNHILHNNINIVDMLDSNYTFINDELADHYQISGIAGEHFRKINLPANSRRGGLLGQASILTLTSNGIETSPVIRGIWILENILGTPPSPPPPDVEPLEPDARGSTTIREQLEKHRSVEACAECHKKMDPLGFALENYDPVGVYRQSYPRVRGQKNRTVDASGKLPNGDNFTDAQGLKKILVDRKDQFTKALTEKLLIYATGRKMTFKDHKNIEHIVEEVIEKGYGLRDMVTEVAISEVFANK
jgi:hypothetical protein